MEDNEENMETTAESVENIEKSNVEEKKKEEAKTFTRDEVNKMINAEKQKAKEEALKEVEAKKAEAEKLAKMDEEQKKSYELQQALERAEKAEKILNARDLETETIRQAREKDINLGYIDTIDFTKETADSIRLKLETFKKIQDAEKERIISEYSKEPAPQTGEKVTQNLSGYEKFIQNKK